MPRLPLSSSCRDPLEPCNRPGLKSCMGFTVTWTMSSAGLEQNLLFQQQKLKIKHITTLAFSLRRVHCAPDCARCKHCHPTKKGTGQEIWKGRCQFDWAQRCWAAWLHPVRQWILEITNIIKSPFPKWWTFSQLRALLAVYHHFWSHFQSTYSLCQNESSWG